MPHQQVVPLRMFVIREVGKWQNIPVLKFTDQYYGHPAFINAIAKRIQSCHPESFDYIVFSYHGLPVRHINNGHPDIHCNECTCLKAMTEFGRHCYKAACYDTTRLIAEKSGLAEGTYTTSFQSRLSRNWVTPFTDETLVNLASMGHKKILIVAPSFVADCLETTIELGEDYVTLFRQNQGQELILAESLNDRDEWVDAVIEIVRAYSDFKI